MSKLLVIKGHPLTYKESYTLKGLGRFKEVYKQKYPSDSIDYLDLFSDYIPEFDAEVFHFQNYQLKSRKK